MLQTVNFLFPLAKARSKSLLSFINGIFTSLGTQCASQKGDFCMKKGDSKLLWQGPESNLFY